MTYSHNGPREPGRSDLSAKPGEGFGAWAERVRQVAVIDPELVDQERRRMAAEDQHRRVATGLFKWRATRASRWLLGFLAALGASALLSLVTGLTVWVAAACAIGSAASLAAYMLAVWQARSALMSAPGPVPGLRQAVLLTELDETCRELLRREQRAIAEVISSGIYGERPYAQLADEATLRLNEWQVAVNLRALTLRRAQHEAIPVLGDQTAGVLDRHQRYLTAAEDAAQANVREIESLAAQVRRAELEFSDRENARKAAGLDGRYEDLGAGAAAFELAIDEIKSLTSKIAPLDAAEWS